MKVSFDFTPVGLSVVLYHIIICNNESVQLPMPQKLFLNLNKTTHYRIEKEAAAIIFGIKKFQQYLFGRKLVLVIDLQPLISVFALDKAVPTTAAARPQRWAVLLFSFVYSIEYKNGSKHSDADALARAPVES